MTFQVHPLPAERFAPLFDLDTHALVRAGAVRRTADAPHRFPCRVSLADAEPGEEVLLLNFEHQPASTPFRSRHAIYVRRGAATAAIAAGEVPALLLRRTLALRAFDAEGMIVAAELAAGEDIAPAAARMLDDGRVAYLHAHNAALGCYFARIDRA